MAKKQIMPLWFYQLASPKYCYQITSKLLPLFAGAALVLLSVELLMQTVTPIFGQQ